jgi:hypothetical protein
MNRLIKNHAVLGDDLFKYQDWWRKIVHSDLVAEAGNQ